jgi:hypothetical protein
LCFRNSPDLLFGGECVLRMRYARESLHRRIMAKRPLVMRILGIALICIGLLTLALPYITFTKQEKVIDIGPLEAVAEKKERIPISPVIGGVVFIAGAAIVIASMRKGSL